jgi:Di-haem oxidoreductase, putative peroxidase
MKRIPVVLCALVLLACVVVPVPPNLGTESDVPATGAQEALAGFDDKTNGIVDQATFDEDQAAFNDVEVIADGLGPLFNAASCLACHQNPVSGGGSQVTELRAGVRDAQGRFEPARVPIAHGKVVIEGRTLINDRAICPNGAYPDTEIQQHVPDNANVRTFRLSISVLGDGLIEAVADESLRAYATRQCKETHGTICGHAFEVPVLEAPGANRIGRFGWKGQQASLLSFSADAYLNEMGITSRLQPDEVTTLCDTVADPEDRPPCVPCAAHRHAHARGKQAARYRRKSSPTSIALHASRAQPRRHRAIWLSPVLKPRARVRVCLTASVARPVMRATW